MQLVVRKRFGDEWVYVTDFIRPNEFMIEQVLRTRGNWTLNDLWQWVITNIKYPHGSNKILDQHTLYAYHQHNCLFFHSSAVKFSVIDYWSYPSETLRDRIGDCEDSAFLLVSMVRKALPDISIYATVGTFDGYGHVWASVKKGNDWQVLDTTLKHIPAVIPFESWGGPSRNYIPIFRFNEKEVIVESKELIVPENVYKFEKDNRIKSWYMIIEKSGKYGGYAYY